MSWFLHIGAPKTGTTSIQYFLKQNANPLRRRGIAYPPSISGLNRKKLPIALGTKKITKGRFLTDPPDIDALRESVRQEAAGARMGVISGEFYWLRTETTDLPALRTFLAEFFEPIKVVVYLRRQDEFAMSTWATAIKGQASVEPLALPSGPNLAPRYDYWRALSHWASVFGRENILCRKYERGSLVKEDVVDDFLTVTDINAEGMKRTARLNESLDATTLEFLRLVNHHITTLSRRPKETLDWLAEISTGPSAALPDDELARFQAQFADSNRMVANEYFGGALTGSDDPLFAPRKKGRAGDAMPHLPVDRAVEIAAHLLRRFAENGATQASHADIAEADDDADAD